VLREHETELGNASTEAGGLFDEENFESGVCQIKRSTHPTNAAANNHGCGHRVTACMPATENGHRAPHHFQTLARLLLRSLGHFHYKRVFNHKSTMRIFSQAGDKQNDRLVKDRSLIAASSRS
jgi:hypothetical protein